jgi:hypothetical protein
MRTGIDPGQTAWLVAKSRSDRTGEDLFLIYEEWLTKWAGAGKKVTPTR